MNNHNKRWKDLQDFNTEAGEAFWTAVIILFVVFVWLSPWL